MKSRAAVCYIQMDGFSKSVLLLYVLYPIYFYWHVTQALYSKKCMYLYDRAEYIRLENHGTREKFNLTSKRCAPLPTHFLAEFTVILLNSHCKTILQSRFCDILCCNGGASARRPERSNSGRRSSEGSSTVKERYRSLEQSTTRCGNWETRGLQVEPYSMREMLVLFSRLLRETDGISEILCFCQHPRWKDLSGLHTVEGPSCGSHGHTEWQLWLSEVYCVDWKIVLKAEATPFC